MQKVRGSERITTSLPFRTKRLLFISLCFLIHVNAWGNPAFRFRRLSTLGSTVTGKIPDPNSLNRIRSGGKEQINNGSNAMIVAKSAASVGFETAGLLGAIKLSEVASSKVIGLPIFGLHPLQWIAIVFVIFSSSTIKSWVEGSVGAATDQVLRPDVVPGDPSWYASLKKPWFNPPGWAFPIMWLLVSKPTQLIAVSKVLKTSSPTAYWPALAIYCSHLALGDAWNDVFFGRQRVGLGAVVISTFFGFLLTSAKLFWAVDPSAGKILLPTCVWVFVATSLNLSIYFKNKNK
jgi:tryptophan-rich sensory protein